LTDGDTGRAPHGIRVNAIAPGTTETESRAPNLADPAHRERMLNRIPLRRFGTAEEMAGAVRYLASPLASYITGSQGRFCRSTAA
jgi:NAD(P)-dependent dehydrogenase (short-subunit alcohol dehydrogenase family)